MRSGVMLQMASFKPVDPPETARLLLGILEESGGIYVPEIIGDETKYRPGQPQQGTQHWTRDGGLGVLLLQRKQPCEVAIILNLNEQQFLSLMPHSLFVSIDISHFITAQRLDELLHIGNRMYDVLSPCYGFIELPWMPDLAVTFMPERGLPGWGWATWLGPEYERLVQFPQAVRIRMQSMPDSGRLILLPYPADPRSPDPSCLCAHEHVMQHVDPLVFQPPPAPIIVASRDPVERQMQRIERLSRPVVKEGVRLPQFRFRN